MYLNSIIHATIDIYMSFFILIKEPEVFFLFQGEIRKKFETKPSWFRSFFRVKNRSLVDKSTGTEKEIPI